VRWWCPAGDVHKRLVDVSDQPHFVACRLTTPKHEDPPFCAIDGTPPHPFMRPMPRVPLTMTPRVPWWEVPSLWTPHRVRGNWPPRPGPEAWHC
jgi:hypothetical protein